MNSLLLVTLLAAASALAVNNEESEVPAAPELTDLNNDEVDENGVPLEIIPESRRSLSVGTIGSNDRQMARITHKVAASSFVIHDQDVTFRGHEYTNITAIRVARTGSTTNAVPTITAGGLTHNYVTIRIRGVRSQGFDYTITVHASINCSNS